MSLFEYINENKIKESLCIEFFEACLKLQENQPYKKYKIVSYREVMPYMHIGRDRLQRVLDSITRNKIYFKLKGYRIYGSNIVSSIDWSKRFTLFGEPVYHFHVEKYEPQI